MSPVAASSFLPEWKTGGTHTSFAVFADGSANLPGAFLDGITVLPCEYTLDGKTQRYQGDIDRFDAHAYYEKLKAGAVVRTTLLNTEVFLSGFRPALSAGVDVVYISMSSGISGTCHAAETAAMELREEFPDRFIHIVDSLGCGFGSGLLAVKAAELSRQGMDARAAAGVLDEEVQHTCQYFTVDDLEFLKRTGRVSGFTAKIATVLNIKPILYGDGSGHIVSCGKSRGRQKAIEFIASKYREKRITEKEPLVFISHGDCLKDAENLSEKVKTISPDARTVICQHEPFSGGHVGPGMLGLFFRGKDRS